MSFCYIFYFLHLKFLKYILDILGHHFKCGVAIDPFRLKSENVIKC